MKKTIAGIAIIAAGFGMQSGAQTNMTAPSWTDSITIKGDLRYRFETIGDDSKKDGSGDTYTRQRDRIRARIGADAKVNDDVKVGIGFSTGGNDPISGNQTLGDGAGKKDMKLDVAYFDYNVLGSNPNEIHVVGGKMYNPFITMNDDLCWDPDLRPEGLAVKSQFGGDFATFYANGGYLWLQERDSKDPLMLYAGQAAVKLQFVPEASLTLGVAYDKYNNLKGTDVIDWQGANSGYGNSTTKGSISGTTTNKAWASDFTPLMFFAQVDLWVEGLPLALFTQQLDNNDASTNGKGYLYGVSLGKAKNPKTFEVGYSYSKLEKDATLGYWTDSDRWGGGTDGKGSKIYGKYQIMKNLQAGVTYFVDDKKISAASPTDYSRLQVDLMASF